jgi:hypothetical protein
MKINSRLHAILDYGMAFMLLLPWIVNFNDKSPDSILFFFLGSIIIIYSLMTDYELGMVKLIPMGTHRVFDFVSGLILVLTPLLFEVYSYYLYWPAMLGVLMILLSVFSSSVSYRITRRDLDITRPGS